MTNANSAPGTPVPAKPASKRKTKTKITPTQRQDGEDGPVNKHWRTYFLQKLAETSNIKASADYAGISASRAYKVRREDTEFETAWRAALLEGYAHLEMDVLGYLRGNETERKIDVANALRCLKAHSETVARQRAMIDDRDEQEVLDSIDAMIDEMRQRNIANSAILAELDSEDDPDDG